LKKARIEELTKFHRDSLLESTIPFWMKHTIDTEYGGFLNFLDHDGTVLSTDKPVWVLGRFTWLMAFLYNNVEKRQEWLDTSKHGDWFKYLHRDGTISSTVKGNRWAGPFHLPRKQYNCWKLLEEMNA
jgi:N-acylglucosamine 2-epimerase